MRSFVLLLWSFFCYSNAAADSRELELPCEEHLTEPLPVPWAIVTLTQNILGAGILTLPFAFKCAGLLGAIALISLIFGLSVLSMGVLLLVSNHCGEFSYSGLALRSLGDRSSTLVSMAVLFFTLGGGISYPILLGQFLQLVGVELGAPDWFTVNLWMAIAIILVGWPLSCAPSLGFLMRASLAGLTSILFTVMVVVLRYFDNTYDGPEKNNFSMLEVQTFGEGFPVLVCAFGAHYCIPLLYHEVAPKIGALATLGPSMSVGSSEEDTNVAFGRMMRVIVGAVSLSTVVYSTVGFVVYATFGQTTESDFSINFAADDKLLLAVRLSLSVAICVSFPLCLVSARDALFNIVLKPRGWRMTPAVRITVSTILSAFCLSVAMLSGDVGVVSAYSGSVFGTPVCFIIPPVMYLCLPRQYQQPKWRAFCIVCTGLGAFFFAFGIYSTTMSVLKKNK
eukprot:TRINITY_DN10859_c0_g2_i1.p1 TRINITY_DN10859_c0_g2~~TRINITY_DN10859_c0_g2_i1.p1  ORF type:complete len:451 (-),score=66.04 TRINITY_DN10859_c0_g2_i1:9-1361(-)